MVIGAGTGMGGTWKTLGKKLSSFVREERLTIFAYDTRDDRKLGTPVKQRFEAMYNPESIKISYQNRWQMPQGIGTHGIDVKFAANVPEQVRFTLIFSRTGVERTLGGIKGGGEGGMVGSIAGGLVSGASTSLSGHFLGGVAGMVEEFLMLTTQIVKTEHEPYYLTLQWGHSLVRLADSAYDGQDVRTSPHFAYPCRLLSADLKYTLFDRMGNPLRAEVDALFIEDGKEPAGGGLQSPDVTHKRTVKAGDTLPLMTNEIYEDPSYTIRVAEANGLDSIRSLRPGKDISFPPIAK